MSETRKLAAILVADIVGYSKPFLKLRASKTDEQVVKEAADSDEEFKARIKREAGLDISL